MFAVTKYLFVVANYVVFTLFVVFTRNENITLCIFIVPLFPVNIQTMCMLSVFGPIRYDAS